jgi:multicomponent Na+:H+ antiporter subunit E
MAVAADYNHNRDPFMHDPRDLTHSRMLSSGQRHGIGLAARLVAYAAIWSILTAGNLTSWLWGAPAIIAAAAFNPFRGDASWTWHPSRLPRFVPVFIWFSLRSAVDVAWRALQPRRPLQPTLVDYFWRLPPGRSRIFLANLINLMPGTLCVHIADRALTVHLLDSSSGALAGLRHLEGHVARLFGLTIHD